MTSGIAALKGFDMTGRVALVTGASSGFGAHFSRILAAAGAKVVMGARRVERLEALKDEIEAAGGEALAVAMDVTDEASTIAAYNAAEARFGTVNTIIANAGISAETLSVVTAIEDFDAVVATNLKGVFLTAREGARRLMASGSAQGEAGRVVVIGSITADRIFTGTAGYSATKIGVRHMARMMAREWARKGINVNVIQPGYFLTEITGDLFESDMGKALLATFPRKRMCEMDSLTIPLLYLASDASRGVTGSVFTIDDGQTL